jgi:hypothetical protein
MFFERLLTICFLVTLFYFGFPSFAHAYLDPGTTSYILQMLVAALVGGAFVIKLFWTRITAFFRNLSSKGKKQEEADD